MHRYLLASAFALTLLAYFQLSARTNLEIRVKDASGAPLGNVLVIVRPLERAGAGSRLLADSSGLALFPPASPCIYQIIVTDPYGTWETVIREVIVSRAPTTQEISVRPLPTHGIGDTVVIAPSAAIKVLNPSVQAAPNTDLYVRDQLALYSAWYRTDANGVAHISTFGDGTEVVAFRDNRISTLTLRFPGHHEDPRDCLDRSPSTNSPQPPESEFTLQLK